MVLNISAVDAEQYIYIHDYYWYRSDGSRIANARSTYLSVQTNDDDILGIYIGLIFSSYYHSTALYEDYCRLAYFSYDYHYIFPVGLSLWNIKVYGIYASIKLILSTYN